MSKISFTPARHRRRKKVLKLSKGYVGSKSTIYKTAHEQVMRSLKYAYRDRKQRKRQFRRLWITRINAAVFHYGLQYSTFIHGLILSNVEINRKFLSQLAIQEKEVFAQYIELAKTALKEKKTSKSLSNNINQVSIKEITSSKGYVIDNIKNNSIKKRDIISNIKVNFEPSITKETESLSSIIKDNSTKLSNHSRDGDANNLDLNNMLVKDLKMLAKENNIPNFNKLKKIDLINSLKHFYKNNFKKKL